MDGNPLDTSSLLYEGRHELALSVIRKLREHSFPAYLVGGCVRDRLLGRQPKDYDVSTSATPQQLMQLFPNAVLVGAHFGVILVRESPNVSVEVATFRSEGTYSDGRRPDAVRFETDPALDAKRRDFTINGLFEDPFSGQLLDFVQGEQDLKARTLRAIGNPRHRFAEDHLRLLRAIRFAARLDFQIEPLTKAAISELAGRISTVAPERIREELTRILMEGGASYGLELLSETGLLQQLLPEVEAFHGVEQPPQYHPEGDVWTHVLMMLQAMQHPSHTLAWGVLLHDVGKPPTFERADRIRFNGHAEVGARMAASITNRLKFSNEESEQITSLVANHMRFKDVQQMRVSTLKRFLRLPSFSEHLELHRLDCQASNGYTDAYRYVQQVRESMADEQISPPRLVSGKDLIKAGYRPGPYFKEVLEAVENAQLEGEVTTSEQALQWALQYLDTQLPQSANKTAT